MTSKDLLGHPSLARELGWCRDVGIDVVVNGTTVGLYVQHVVPASVAETFAQRIRALDSEGVLTVNVGSEAESQTVALLRKYNVPLETWGTGDAKTLGHLLAELASGECRLEERGGMLGRYAEGAVVDVFYRDDARRWRLIEDRQVFRDGRVKRRGLDTIGEKMKPGESPWAAGQRALSEELGIAVPLALTPMGVSRKGPVPSVAFPGLYTVYDKHAFAVTLPPELVKSEGYVEHQEDKSTYFVWVPADGT